MFLFTKRKSRENSLYPLTFIFELTGNVFLTGSNSNNEMRVCQRSHCPNSLIKNQ